MSRQGFVASIRAGGHWFGDGQRVRSVQDRHRPVELPHGRPDARGGVFARRWPRTAARAHDRVQAELFGSLGATGHGHGSYKAVLLGLEGEDPRRSTRRPGRRPRRGDPRSGRLRLERGPTRSPSTPRPTWSCTAERLPFHPNGMTFTAYADDVVIDERTYYSIGGGFVVDDDGSGQPTLQPDPTPVPYPFRTGTNSSSCAMRPACPLSDVALANEYAWRPEAEVRSGLLRIWAVMGECVRNGCSTPASCPAGSRSGAGRRPAPELVTKSGDLPSVDPLRAMDWVTLWALAVNEENASGGRVVTAPTNGAAGIIPAVLHYCGDLRARHRRRRIVRFLLVAGALGSIYQQTASISGAEVGCQGEVGTACSMAAGALAEILGGTPEQVENAAEIGMEHHLGLTCDPIGGLVQIPCIERNAVASVKAITAARLALHGDGTHTVSLDKVIKTMMQTGADMRVKYKETARGGLAVNIVEC